MTFDRVSPVLATELFQLAKSEQCLKEVRETYRVSPNLENRLALFAAALDVVTTREKLQAQGLTVKVRS